MNFTNLNTATLIENPPGWMNTHYKKPDQCIQPYQFGDSATKATSLWLYGLPKLTPTKIVEKPPVKLFSSGKKQGDWFYKTGLLPIKERSKARSKTFPGLARAIAEQYHDFLTKKN